MNDVQKKKRAQEIMNLMKELPEELSQKIVTISIATLIYDQYTMLALDLRSRKPKTKKEIRRERRRRVILNLKLKLHQFRKACMHLTKRERNI